MIKTQQGTKLLVAVYVIIFLLCFAFNCLTPMAADDFDYSYNRDGTRLESVFEIIPSMDRSGANGRTTVHAFVQLFLLMPKAVFNIFNAFNMIFILYMFSCICGADTLKSKVFVAVCGFLFVWNCTPAYSGGFLWLDGSINYSWVVSSTLIFILPYIQFYFGEKRMNRWVSVLFLIHAFAMGTCAESYSPSAVIIAAMLYVMAFLRTKKHATELLLGIIAALLGFLYLYTAPASATRMSDDTISSLASNLRYMILLAKDELLYLYITYAAVLYLAIVKKCDTKRITASLILVLGGLASLAAYSLAVYIVDRHMIFAAVITVLAVLVLLTELNRRECTIPGGLLSAGLAVLFLFNLLLGGIDLLAGYKNYRERERIITQALENGEKDIFLRSHIASTKYCVTFWLSGDRELWPNITIADYYGLDSITGLPE